MTENTTKTIDTTPESNEIWASLGTHFDSLSEILCEFIDNSISNYKANRIDSREIFIKIKDNGFKKGVDIRIEDVGTGIQDIGSAFTLGKKECRETPLNEHGFGMKHALASANPDNNNWKILTRTVKDKENQLYQVVSAPYIIGSFPIEEIKSEWIGEHGSTGTVILFTCTWSLFKAKYRSNVTVFDKIIDYLLEDLGFIYSAIIKKGEVRINLTSIDENNNSISHNVEPLKPGQMTIIDPGEGAIHVSLTEDENICDVTLNYGFYKYTEGNTYKYYKNNQKSSGVELRINGRLLCYNLLDEIWKVTGHNRFNHFLAVIDLVSDNRDSLPKTKASKNGLRNGDPKLEKVFEIIKKLRNEPYSDTRGKGVVETDLFYELKEIKESQFGNDAIVEVQKHAYLAYNEKIRIDFYFYRKDKNYLTIYEGKKVPTEPLDAYQLMMYWDGLVSDGIPPDEAILISTEHSDSVQNIIEAINNKTDARGENYNFKLKTWKEEHVKYPE